MIDSTLLVLFVFFFALSLIVGQRLKYIFRKYSEVQIFSGMSGKEVAEKMLLDHGIHDVQVTATPGKLTDHYNPQTKTVNLSEEVYNESSVSAAAVAAHECGHAVQHAESYKWLELRSKLVPVVNFASNAMTFVYLGMFILGYMYSFMSTALILIIVAQALITAFSFITLPVEIDASRRANQWLLHAGITQGEQTEQAATALRWAGYTYVVAALASLSTLLYYILRFVSSD